MIVSKWKYPNMALRSSLFQLSDLNDTLAALKSFVARFMARTWNPSPSSLWVSKLWCGVVQRGAEGRRDFTDVDVAVWVTVAPTQSRTVSAASGARLRGAVRPHFPPASPPWPAVWNLKSLVSAMDWRNTTVVTNCVYQRVSAKWSNDPDDLGVAVDETSIWTSCRVFQTG